MGRSWAILAVFAVLVGACAYWAPFKLHSTADKPSAAVVEHSEDVADAAPAEPQSEPAAGREPVASHSTIPSVRKGDSPINDSRARQPVLVATTPTPASPLAALPEKVIPGFPPRPQKELANDHMASVLKQSKYLRGEGQLLEARDLLSDTYLNHRLTPEQRKRLGDELEPLSWEILQSQSMLQDGQLYEVQAGDVLVKIAKPFQVPPEFVMKLNGLKSARSIRPRQKLKLVQGPFDVLAEISEFELTILHRGKFIRRFSVGVGRSDSPTPVGLFKVGTKLTNPTYYPPPSDSEHRRPIPPGTADNPLGTRWIDIGLGYGIHGTSDARSVGQESSRGCIRMRNEDVEELYDMLTEGSRVLIR